MLEFYERMMLNEQLPKHERDNYRRMYEAAKKNEVKYAEEKPVQEEMVFVEDDCEGCKI